MKKTNLLLLGISIVVFLGVGVFAYNDKISYDTWIGSGVVIGSIVLNLAQMFGIKRRDERIEKLQEANMRMTKAMDIGLN